MPSDQLTLLAIFAVQTVVCLAAAREVQRLGGRRLPVLYVRLAPLVSLALLELAHVFPASIWFAAAQMAGTFVVVLLPHVYVRLTGTSDDDSRAK